MAVTWEERGWQRLTATAGRVRLPGWDCTAGLVAGADGSLLVDAGSSLAEGALLRNAAHALTGRPVTRLALTHPHFDHVLGAPAFPGAEVFVAADEPGAADGVFGPRGAAALRADAVRNGLDPAAADAASAALTAPDRAVHSETPLDLGGGVRVVLAAVGPGHTAHDLAVLVEGGAGGVPVVFCGDLVEESGEPQAGEDAVPARWPAALDHLLALGGPDALYVPGHGAVVDAAFVRAQRDVLARRFGVS